MTNVAKMKKPVTCEKCSGLDYLLSVRNGFVRARACGCFKCEQCNGSGRIFEEDEVGRSSVRPCGCKKFHQRLRMLSSCGIPAKFIDATFASFRISAKNSERSKNYAKTVAMDFVKNYGKQKRGLVFTGEPGLGKTHLAISIVQGLVMEKGADCKFVDFFQLLSDIRHGFSQDVSELVHILPYLQSQILVIDELGKGRNTDWEHGILDQVISHRYNTADRITIYTTNYVEEPIDKKERGPSKVNTRKEGFSERFAHESLESRLGPRIYSRMIETCDFLHLEGEDYRQTQKTHHRL